MTPINQVLAVLAAAYPTHELTAPTIRIYNELLGDLSPELLAMAARLHIARSDWYPTVAQLRAAVADMLMDADGIPSAYAAWEAALATGGAGAHPLVAAAMRQIGLDSYSLRRSEAVAADRARFIEAYNQLVAARRQGVVQPTAVRDYVDALRVEPPPPVARLVAGDDGATDAAGMPLAGREVVTEAVQAAARHMRGDGHRPGSEEERIARRAAAQQWARRQTGRS